MGVVEEMRRYSGVIKERVLEKLSAAAVPADALENARNFLENLVKDVTLAAHGLTRETLNRIKSHLAEILPSLSPAITTKMVDDATREANSEGSGCEERDGEEKGNRQKPEHSHQTSSNSTYASPASSFFASIKPSSRL